jgi:hypothetical protein
MSHTTIILQTDTENPPALTDLTPQTPAHNAECPTTANSTAHTAAKEYGKKSSRFDVIAEWTFCS